LCQLFVYNIEFNYGPIFKINKNVNLCKNPYIGGDAYVTGGYDKVIESLSNALDIRINQCVEFINYKDDVIVKTQNSIYYADYVIVTVTSRCFEKQYS
jgi:hypothetical protein